MWYSIAITPKCFTYLPYGISFHERFSWMSTLTDISWLFLCVLRRSTIAGPGIWWNIISNQFGTLKFFWLKIARKMTDVFTWQSLFLNTWVWKCILLYFLSILVHSIGTDHRKKSLRRKYVLLRHWIRRKTKAL